MSLYNVSLGEQALRSPGAEFLLPMIGHNGGWFVTGELVRRWERERERVKKNEEKRREREKEKWIYCKYNCNCFNAVIKKSWENPVANIPYRRRTHDCECERFCFFYAHGRHWRKGRSMLHLTANAETGYNYELNEYSFRQAGLKGLPLCPNVTEFVTEYSMPVSVVGAPHFSSICTKKSSMESKL